MANSDRAPGLAPVAGFDVPTPDGRVLRAYDSASDGTDAHAPVLLWHHGSPQTGAPLDPVRRAAADRGIRLVSYARPSYGGSTPLPGRTVATAAADVAAVMDAVGVDRFAVIGASGGGPHVLAAAALLPERVSAAITLAGLAPRTDAAWWWAGMQAPDALRSAVEGRAARAAFAAIDEFDPDQFIAADYAALQGAWSALGDDVGRSDAWGDDGLIDDDVAFAQPWGFDPGTVRSPVLLVHGVLDRVVPVAHSQELAAGLPRAELWLRPDDGHVSVLESVPETLDWLLATLRRP